MSQNFPCVFPSHCVGLWDYFTGLYGADYLLLFKWPCTLANKCQNLTLRHVCGEGEIKNYQCAIWLISLFMKSNTLLLKDKQLSVKYGSLQIAAVFELLFQWFSITIKVFFGKQGIQLKYEKNFSWRFFSCLRAECIEYGILWSTMSCQFWFWTEHYFDCN